MAQTSESKDGFTIAIRRAKIDTLIIYEISEDELRMIEHGSPDSIYLTIAISLISFASAIFCSLLSTEIVSQTVMTTYVLIVIIGFVSGAILLILWKRTNSSVSACIAIIRKRLPPPEGKQTKPEND